MNTPTSPFSIEFLQAVNDWQRGGDAKQNRKRGESLRSQCRSLPETFRESPLVCHRQIALPKSGVWDLIGAGKLTEKVSSSYQGVPVGTIKKHATGKGNAGKGDVIAAMRAKGHPVTDDNEADALALLHWAIETQEA